MSTVKTITMSLKDRWLRQYEADLHRDGRFLRMLLNNLPKPEPEDSRQRFAHLGVTEFPMRPRLRMRRGVWVCSMPGAQVPVMGHGYTPIQAYEEWAVLMAATLR